MSTNNSGQENRYLESPHVIRGSGSDEQMPFFASNPVGSGFSFSKDNFVVSADHESDDSGNKEVVRDEELAEMFPPAI